MSRSPKRLLLFPVVLSTVLAIATDLGAQATAFTYQGRLGDNNAAATGTYDLRFKLNDSNGVLIGSTFTNGVGVSNGLFTVTVDFGAGAFDGTPRVLVVGVRTNGGPSFTDLAPGQPVRATPYAIKAASVAGTIGDSQLSANVALLNGTQTFTGANTFSGANNLNNAGNSFVGNGAGLTSLNAGGLSSGTVPFSVLPATLARLDQGQTFSGANNFNNAGNLFVGNGAGLTSLNAGSIASGVVPFAALPATLARLDLGQSFSGIPGFNGGTSGVSPPFTVDSTFAVPNLNADLLDGLNSGQFLRSDTGNAVIQANAGSAVAPSFTFAGDSNTGLFSPGADALSVSAGGSQQVQVDTSGVTIRGILERTDPGGIQGSYNALRYNDSYQPSTGIVMGNSGDLYVTFDIELGAALYLNRFIYMLGTTNTSADSSQYIYFYNNGSRSAETFSWNDSADRFEFTDDVNVAGTLTKSAGSFKIDHPLDPANKYLSHSFVESPDMKNVYDGVLILDAAGQGVVELPGWFEALNKDFRYQLTAMGAPAPYLHVSQEVNGNRFAVAGGNPGQRISWQVTGVRRDAYANAHRIPVEEDKPAEERGTYLHAVEHGQPASLSLEAVETQRAAVDIEKANAAQFLKK